MIVKMKKVSVVGLDAYKAEYLKKIRQLGVLHLEEVVGKGETLASLNGEAKNLEQAMLLLESYKSDKTRKPNKKIDSSLSVQDIINTILGIQKKIKVNNDQIDKNRKEIESIADLGDFNPADILELKDKGISLRLFMATLDKFPLIEGDSVFEFARTKSTVFFTAIDLPAEDTIEAAEEIPLPEKGLGAYQKEIAELEHKNEALENDLVDYTVTLDDLAQYEKSISKEIEFENIKTGLGVDEELFYAVGYAPFKVVADVEKAAEENSWALLIEDPEEEDPVPTLVENKGPARLAAPVLDFLGTVPGYREFDISLWLFIAMTIFFAMIIGDAGYGAIFLVLTIVARIKMPKAPAEPFLFFACTSVATIIWGAMTGTWFSVEAVASNEFLNSLTIPYIASFPGEGLDTSQNIMYICFVIAIIHLTIGRITAFIGSMPSLKAISELGWLSILWGLFFFVLNIVLGMELLPIAQWLILGGFVAVVFFGQQEGNFVKGLLAGLSFPNLLLGALDTIGAFSNIISYVRLFAVGLASVEVAKSFNALAMGLGFEGPSAIGAVLVLILGHGLNIIMGALSVVVHGVRLNLLEYSGQLGMTWSGFEYKPFKD